MLFRVLGPRPPDTIRAQSQSFEAESLAGDSASDGPANLHRGLSERRKRKAVKKSHQHQRGSKKKNVPFLGDLPESDDELSREPRPVKRKKRSNVTTLPHYPIIRRGQETPSENSGIEYDEPGLESHYPILSDESELSELSDLSELSEFSTNGLAYQEYKRPVAQPSKRRKSISLTGYNRGQASSKKEHLSSDDGIFGNGDEPFLKPSKLRKSTSTRERRKSRITRRKHSPSGSSSGYYDDSIGKPFKRRESVLLTRSLRTKIRAEIHDSLNEDQLQPPATRNRSTVITPKIPPWYSLPYEILRDIFFYASHPIQDDYFEPNVSVYWLVRTALVCRAFSDPALSVLYYAPPLYPDWRVKDLMSSLSMQGPRSTINYKSKVKYIDMLSTNVLLQKPKGPNSVSLENLIKLIPRVRGIAVHLLSDRPQHRVQLNMLDERPKLKVYRKSVFDALSENEISLRSWKWNFKFDRSLSPEGTYPWSDMAQIHMETPFCSLRELTISRYDSKSNIEETDLATALCALPELRSLSLDSCSSSPDELLPLLPRELESLTITSMTDLTSDTLLSYLLTHGSNLRELILNHNQSLNIGFLVDLAYTCPALETLSMDMAFYSCFGALENSEPKFRTLLPEGIVPTWPTTLQSIELLHLRKWGSERAKVFLKSLEDSSHNLRQLRRLTLRTSIEIAWRDRTEFRDEWIGRLRKAFLRCSLPPGNFVIWGRSADSGLEYPTSTVIDFPSKQPGRRNRQSGEFSHVAIPTYRRSSERVSNASDQPSHTESEQDAESDDDSGILKFTDDEDIASDFAGGFPALNNDPEGIQYSTTEVSDSDAPVVGKPRASRSSRAEYSDDDDSESLLSDVDETIIIEGPGLVEVNHFTIPVPPRTGMCDRVDIRIDNLRPAQVQFTENDFLDSERSGDEDWDGDDNMRESNA
jgi:hypothetical protein